MEEGGENDGAEKSEWSLVEDVFISGPRFVVGIVKGKCEENWRGIHGRLLKHMNAGLAETAETATA